MKRWLALGASVLLFWGAATACSGGGGGGGGTGPAPGAQTALDFTLPDGSIQHSDGSVTHPDGSVTYADGHVTFPDGSVQDTNGVVKKPDGTVKLPDGAVKLDNGQYLLPNGAVVTADGTVIKQSNILPPSGTGGTPNLPVVEVLPIVPKLPDPPEITPIVPQPVISGLTCDKLCAPGVKMTASAATSKDAAKYAWQLMASNSDPTVSGSGGSFEFSLKADVTYQLSLTAVSATQTPATTSVTLKGAGLPKAVISCGDLGCPQYYNVGMKLLTLNALSSTNATSFDWNMTMFDGQAWKVVEKAIAESNGEPQPTYSFKNIASAGKYQVNLTAHGPGGESPVVSYGFEVAAIPIATITGNFPNSAQFPVGPILFEGNDNLKVGDGVYKWQIVDTVSGKGLFAGTDANITFNPTGVGSFKAILTVQSKITGFSSNPAEYAFSVLPPPQPVLSGTVSVPNYGNVAVNGDFAAPQKFVYGSTFSLSASLSKVTGVAYYTWKLNGKDFLGSGLASIKIPVQAVGDYTLTLHVVDIIGVGDQTYTFSVVPIPFATIGSVLKSGRSYVPGQYSAYVEFAKDVSATPQFDWTVIAPNKGFVSGVTKAAGPADLFSFALPTVDVASAFGLYKLLMTPTGTAGGVDVGAASKLEFYAKAAETAQISPLNLSNIESVSGISADDLYIASMTHIYHYGADKRWVHVLDASAHPLMPGGLFVHRGGDVFALAMGQGYWHYTYSKGWSYVQIEGLDAIDSVLQIDGGRSPLSKAVWISTNTGKLIRITDSSVDVNAVKAKLFTVADDDHVYFTGIDNLVISRFDATTQQTTPLDFNALTNLLTIQNGQWTAIGSDETFVYLALDNGNLYYYLPQSGITAMGALPQVNANPDYAVGMGKNSTGDGGNYLVTARGGMYFVIGGMQAFNPIVAPNANLTVSLASVYSPIAMSVDSTGAAAVMNLNVNPIAWTGVYAPTPFDLPTTQSHVWVWGNTMSAVTGCGGGMSTCVQMYPFEGPVEMVNMDVLPVARVLGDNSFMVILRSDGVTSALHIKQGVGGAAPGQVAGLAADEVMLDMAATSDGKSGYLATSKAVHVMQKIENGVLTVDPANLMGTASVYSHIWVAPTGELFVAQSNRVYQWTAGAGKQTVMSTGSSGAVVALQGKGAGDLYAITATAAFHYDGAAVKPETLPDLAGNKLLDVVVAKDGTVYVPAGALGLLVRDKNGVWAVNPVVPGGEVGGIAVGADMYITGKTAKGEVLILRSGALQ